MYNKNLRNKLFRKLGWALKSPEKVDADSWVYEDGMLVIDLYDAPELKKPGGSIHLEGGGLPGRVSVACDEGGHYSAYCSQCTRTCNHRLSSSKGLRCRIRKTPVDSDGDSMFRFFPQHINRCPVERIREKLVVVVSESY